MLLPYLWEFKGRVVVALAFLVVAKLANVGVPLVLKEMVDSLDAQTAILALPLALLVAYGVAAAFDDALRRAARRRLRARRAARDPAHRAGGVPPPARLSLRFHLERQTGGVSRDIERGTRGISTLLSYMLFSIIPVILEFSLVAVVLLTKFDWRFMAVTFGAVVVYIAFTVLVTEWRMDIRRRANELDSKANTRAIDSLLNYETVKYFNNEEFEARRYDENLRQYESAAVKSEASLGLLNIGQSLIIAIAVTLLMILAAQGVVTRDAHAGRSGARQRAADPALHPAQLPRHGLPRDQAGADRHGPDVPPAGGEPRDRGPARRGRRCRRRSGGDPLRARGVFSYEPKRQILHRRELRDPGRAARSRWWGQRLGQVDARAAAVPLLRRRRRADRL